MLRLLVYLAMLLYWGVVLFGVVQLAIVMWNGRWP
jgi:hypothetical protein